MVRKTRSGWSFGFRGTRGRGVDGEPAFRREVGFPAEIAFFTAAQRGESRVWSATREDHERLKELAERLKGEIRSTARTSLRIVESAGRVKNGASEPGPRNLRMWLRPSLT